MPVSSKHRFVSATGKTLPSVKTIIGGGFNGALLGWMRRNMKEESRAVADRKRTVGKLSHEIIMSRYSNIDVDLSSYDADILYDAMSIVERWDNWLGQTYTTFVVLEQECSLMSEDLGYGGRIDLYAIADDRYILFEIKTGAALYDEHVFQLAAYWELAKDVRKQWRIDELHVICPNLETSTGVCCADYFITDNMRDAAVNVFNDALKMYNSRKKYSAIAKL